MGRTAAHGTDATAHREIIGRAKDIAEQARSTRSRANDAGNIPVETIQMMKQAGLFRVLQPQRWNGYEMDPRIFFEIQMVLANACMSTAWVYGVLGVHPFQLALFDEQAQQDVWRDDDGVLLSSSYQPVARITRVSGGYEVSGRWSFSSGCKHCDWVLLGGIVPSDISESGAPEMRTFLLPATDYQIVDNWDVLGLRATGSHDILVDKAVVPAYRTHNAADGFACHNPGNGINTGPLYRIPWAQLFVRSVSTAAIGAAEGALADYLSIAAKRMPSFSDKGTVHDPIAQSIVAEAVSTIEQARLTLFDNIATLYSAATQGETLPVDCRVRFRYESATVVDRCLAVVTKLQHNLGGRGIYFTSPVARHFLDLTAARAHVANTPSKFGFNLGGTQLGLENQDFFI